MLVFSMLRYTVVVLLAVVFAMGGCKSSKRASSNSSIAEDRFDVFPHDSEIIGGLSLALFREAYVYTRYVKPYESELAWDDTDLAAKCGFNPIKTVDSILWSGHTGTEKAIISIAGLPKKKLLSCLKMFVDEKPDIKLEQDGALTRITGPDGSSVWLGWQDASTLVVGSPAVDKSYLLDRLAGKNSVASNAALVSLLKATNQKAAFWIAAIPQEESPLAVDQSEIPFPPVVGIYWALDVREGLATEIGIRLESSTAAAEASNAIAAGMELIKPEDDFERKLFDKIETKVSGDDLIISIGMSAVEIDELVTQVKNEFGDFFEGGGLEDLLGEMMEQDETSDLEAPIENTGDSKQSKFVSTLVTDCGATLQGRAIVSASRDLSISFVKAEGSQFQGGLQLDMPAGFTGLITPPKIYSGGGQLVAITTSSFALHGNHCGLDDPPTEPGSVFINEFQPAQGIVRAEFRDLRLKSCTGATVCTVSGTIETSGPGTFK